METGDEVKMEIPYREQIVLAPEEQMLVGRISFDEAMNIPREAVRDSSEAAAELTKSLLARKVVPEIRVRYFTDPELNIGGHGKSRKQIFEGNGTRGDAIFRHRHLLKYLKYFIYGPQLPSETIQRFRQVLIDDRGTSGMVLSQLQKVARDEARRLGLQKRVQLAEEFFKLALESEVDTNVARYVRDAVRQAR